MLVRGRAHRAAILAAVVVAAVAAGVLLFTGPRGGYTVTARFINGGQLVKGNPVQSGGGDIGQITRIAITDDGQADVTLEIDEEHAPLRHGTQARIRQFSQSGIANRFVDLAFPPGRGQEIPDGGSIPVEDTETQVDIDELFNTLDPQTRRALQGFIQGQARQFRGRGVEANRGLRYLNPALATSSRLFAELTRDGPVLERFLVDSSRLVTALAERRDALASMVVNLNQTTAALGSRRRALADAIGELPGFMRRANTTFVNLRGALGELDPLVEASRPAARRLGPVLDAARSFASAAVPTLRDLRVAVTRDGGSNDLVDLMASVPPLADIAVDTGRRTLAPGGRDVDVGEAPGAFPTAVEAFDAATPIIAQGRPYTSDLFGWFDDFSTTSPGFDVFQILGRAHASLTETVALFEDDVPKLASMAGPVFQGRFRPCPGAGEVGAADGSNVLSEAEQEALDCTEADRHTGP